MMKHPRPRHFPRRILVKLGKVFAGLTMLHLFLNAWSITWLYRLGEDSATTANNDEATEADIQERLDALLRLDAAEHKQFPADGHPVGVLSLKPASFFESLRNEIDQADPAARCARYGFQYNPAQKTRRIYYGAPIAGEPWELSAVVAAEVKGMYHAMVFSEYNRTHNFSPRPTGFVRLSHGPIMQELFAAKEVRIIPYVNEFWPNHTSNPSKLFGRREFEHREHILQTWKGMGMKDDDIGLLADVDETFTRDFLRALQTCDGIEAWDYEQHQCHHKNLKIIASGRTFESTPECVYRERSWYHPDAIIGRCIEGVGEASDVHPVAPRTEEFLERLPGQGGDCSWKDSPTVGTMWNARDYRMTCGGHQYLLDTNSAAEAKKEYAAFTGFHFHNYFHNLTAVRFKMATYSHPVSLVEKRPLGKLTDDLRFLHNCARQLPDDDEENRRRRVPGGYKDIADRKFLPIYFHDAEYRHRRHEIIQLMVQLDERKYGKPPPTPAQLQMESKVHSKRDVFIPSTFVGESDIYASAWWQSIDRFRKTPLESNKEFATQQDSVFTPILRTGGGRADARLCEDWLDFAVENLSKWWKLLSPNEHPVAVGKLEAYINNTSIASTKMLETTLAVIPFEIPKITPDMERKVWVRSLAATVASLMRHGVARVVVVGSSPLAVETYNQTLPLLTRTFKQTTETLIYIHTDDIQTRYLDRNIHYGALRGLWQLLQEKKYSARWLGDGGSARIKYVYMTDPDQLFHGRDRALLFKELDNQKVLIPHQFQPVPHPYDLGTVEKASKLLPWPEFSTVHSMPQALWSCCDVHKKGQEEREECPSGGLWWQCGFTAPGRGHASLRKYDLVQLSAGSGIVHLAGTNGGRRCVPALKGQCPEI